MRTIIHPLKEGIRKAKRMFDPIEAIEFLIVTLRIQIINQDMCSESSKSNVYLLPTDINLSLERSIDNVTNVTVE